VCGIAGGFFGERTDVDPIRCATQTMCQLMASRGPDHSACIALKRAVIGYVRLAIQVPTKCGNQPVTSSSGRFSVVFNGEIYNYRELAAANGIDLHGRSDAYLVAEMWERFGERSIGQFRGMFAIAIVSEADQAAWLIRDPFGIKPLYFSATQNGTVLFSSSTRALLGAGCNSTIRPETITEYLSYGALPADLAPFEDMSLIPPETYIRFDLTSDGPRMGKPVRYSDVWASDQKTTSNEEIVEAFIESVRAHLVSDVPVSLLLSSGFDSTAIAWACHQLGSNLECLSISGTGDDLEQTRRGALAYGHRLQVHDPEWSSGLLGGLVGAMQRPSIDGLNTYVVCEQVRESGIKVALSGLGGDEALGGYSHARFLRLWPLVQGLASNRVPARLRSEIKRHVASRFPAKAQRIADGSVKTVADLCALQRELLDTARIAQLVGTARPASPPLDLGGHSLRTWMRAEHDAYLQRTLLPDADSYSMAHSVELRVPFVDREFIGVAMGGHQPSLRGALKSRIGKASGDSYLVATSLRPKTGFTLPIQRWLSNGDLGLELEALADPAAAIWSHVDCAAAERLSLLSPGNPRWSEPWSMIVLNEWLGSLSQPAKI
jgi:asparagine synthase (glutamine-hydrolysing)